MTLSKFRILTVDEVLERPEAPQWWKDYVERQRDFNSKHPRCIGCGQFVRKGANICGNCEDYAY